MAELKLLSDGTGKNKQTPFRPTTAAIAGTVNLREALAKKKKSISSSAKSKAVLKTKKPIIKEGNQGFNRTPARWSATRKK